MKLPAISEESTPQELLHGLDGYITAASDALERRDMIDLSGLDAVVDALCARVLTLSSAEQRDYAEKLDQLGARLNILQRTMIEAQAAIKSELNVSATRQKASRAYRKDS